MTKHIYRVLEIIGGEKPIININIVGIKIFNIIINDLEVSLYMNSFKVRKNLSHKNIFNLHIASLYMVTQRLKIFLLNNFELK